MAGEWLKFEKATPDKPEVFAIAARLDIDPDAVVGKLIRVWSWFDTHTVDGNGRGVTAALLDRIATVTGFTRAMEAEGWLVVNDCGVSLPNFDRHTGETAKGRALGAKRSAEHRSKSNAPTVTESVTPALPREEKKREELKQEQKKEPASPSGSRLPTDFVMPDEWLTWARAERPELNHQSEAASFSDYWHGLPGAKARKTDWLGTWRNWIRKADAPRGIARAGPQQAQPVGKQVQGLMALEAMKSGNRMADGRTTDRVAEDVLLVAGPDARR